MATLAFQRAIPGGDLGRGRRFAGDDPVLWSATLFSYYGCQRRKWQQGGSDD
jgi:multiple sugar transport system permease protein